MTSRRACHWTIPNGISVTQWSAADVLHAEAGSFAQPYEEWLTDGDWTPEEKPVREYRLRQLRDIPTLRAELARAEQQAVDLARSEGASWADIGAALGITARRARQQFGGER